MWLWQKKVLGLWIQKRVEYGKGRGIEEAHIS